MNQGQHANRAGRSAARRIAEPVIMVAATLFLAWLMSAFAYQAYAVPSGSMEATIMTGDRLFAEKVSYYFRDPQPGDIVTFEDPEVPGRTLVKRCIATGGQTVDLKDGVVFIDGVALAEPYTNGLPSEPLRTALNVQLSYPYTIPEGHLWVMGDNRTNSNDSRYFGAIDMNTVTGRAALIYWPLSDIGLLV